MVTDILMVTVFESELFDAAFPSVVADNAEGRVVTGEGKTGFTFTDETVSRFTSGAELMQAAGTAVLSSPGTTGRFCSADFLLG